MDQKELFFNESRLNFFGPLTGKYREVAISCLRNLYLRLNGPEADYSYHLTKKDIINIFVESVRNTPLMDDENDVEDAVMSNQERAGWMLRRFKDTGWIEEYMDSGKMQSAYRFTSSGRQFSVPFAHSSSEIITNTQHTRSTLAHLNIFKDQLNTGNVSADDLMIATKLSGEIIGDFNEIIEEIVEQRRDLISSVDREIQAAKEIGDNFFEFMEKRIIPDITIRFSQDSVERYKKDILDHLDNIRNQKDEVKAKIEHHLRKYNPNLLNPNRPSILIWALDRIEHRLTAACDVKMPELRTQTDSFIKRAQVLITHLASLNFGETESVSIFSLVKQLSNLSKNEIHSIMNDNRSRHLKLIVEMVNPEKVKPPKERHNREINTLLEEPSQTTTEEMRRAYIRQELSISFFDPCSHPPQQLARRIRGERA